MTKTGVEVDADELEAKLERLAHLADEVEHGASGPICELMRRTAAQRLTEQGAVDTGNLRNSVETVSSEFVVRRSDTVVEMGIQTGVEYAKYIEYGTGPLGDPAVQHTSRMTWAYYDEEGELRIGKSQPPRPFMRPALYENKKAIGAIIAGTIKEVWG